jgi:GNAT superfamily N-acetyltransferase
LARSWIDAGRYYAELNPEVFQIPTADGLAPWFEELLHQPHTEDVLWLVAERAGRVIGQVQAHLEHPVDDPSRQLIRDLARPRVLVDALCVEQPHRRQGTGSDLMHAVEEWARTRGAALISLDTYVASPLSVSFYQRLGYQRRAIIFQSRLD